jgi:hypothetical protein
MYCFRVYLLSSVQGNTKETTRRHNAEHRAGYRSGKVGILTGMPPPPPRINFLTRFRQKTGILFD